MAEKLQKFKFDGSTSKLVANTRSTRQRTPEDEDPQPKSPGMNEETKVDILASIRREIFKMIKEEMKGALPEEFTILRADINAARAEIASNATAIRAEITSIEM